MTLQELLSDIHGLDERLRGLEQKYGMLTEDMYMLYRLGELEQSKDLIRWVGYCELRQERQKAYTNPRLHPSTAQTCTSRYQA